MHHLKEELVETNPVAPAAPVAPGERIEAIDAVRGFALFGILAVNMALFSHSVAELLSGAQAARSLLDQTTEWLIRWLAESKFYSLFSFLFGLGLVLQMHRAEARGRRFVPLFMRRMLVLLLIGLIHGFLIWIGDILTVYALLGLALLLFRRRSPRALLIWAGLFILLPLMVSGLGTAALEIGRLSPAGAEIERAIAAAQTEITTLASEANRIYATGNFVEITLQRARDLAFLAPYLIATMPSIFGMFLLGLYAGRRGIVQDLTAHRRLLRRVAFWGIGLGLPLNLVYAVGGDLSARTVPTWGLLVSQAAVTLGAPSLSLGYAAGLTLLILARPASWWHHSLAAAGRLALSNYLLQSLVCTFIFYGYGLRLFGQVGAAAGLLLTIGIYVVQLLLSRWWTRHFEYGPAEWLWRSLTYGHWQPFRRPGGARAAAPRQPSNAEPRG